MASVNSSYQLAASRPVVAIISAASRQRMMPSLSVVQTVPSLHKKLAPALSSPPKQTEPSKSPGENHLKPTGTSKSLRSRLSTTRSIRQLLTKVLPTAADLFHIGRCDSK